MTAKSKTKRKAKIEAGTQLITNSSLHFLADVATEVGAATTKFPQPNPTFAALVEEVGEVSKALMDLQNGDDTIEHLRKECVQVAAMAARIATEGDPAFPASLR